MPAFAHRHIKDLYPTFWSKSTEMANALSSVITTEAVENRRDFAVVEVFGWLSRTTLDIIGVAGMGEDFGAIHNPDNEVSNAYLGVFESPRPAGKLGLLKAIARELVYNSLPLKRHDNITVASAALKKVAGRLVQQKQKTLDEDGKLGETDIISVALGSGGFTEDMLVNQIMTFLAAGHETTATSMTWAILVLCQHPEVQTRLREEVRAKLPGIKDVDAAPLTPETLDSLTYLQAVCSEVLRVYPPAGLTKRVAAKDTTILGQFIPKGTEVAIGIRAVNHSKALWGDDATEFKPERWLKSSSGGAGTNFAYLTFLHGKISTSVGISTNADVRGIGPRSCIGQGFAKAEFASLLAVLVGSFEMELDDKYAAIEMETGLTSKPKGGLKVRMKNLAGW